MTRSPRKALAMVNAIIFVMIFGLLAAALLTLISSQTALMEDNIRRVKGHYVAEAGYVHALDLLRRGEPQTTPLVEWTFAENGAAGVFKQAFYTLSPTQGINGTDEINSTCDFTLNW